MENILFPVIITFAKNNRTYEVGGGGVVVVLELSNSPLKFQCTV